MKRLVSKIKDRIEDGIWCLCALIGQRTRILVIVAVVAVFAVANIHIIFRAIYNIARESAKHEVTGTITVIPDSVLQDEEAGELQREMEYFFNKHFNTEENGTTTEE
jgi:hypothetical protein